MSFVATSVWLLVSFYLYLRLMMFNCIGRSKRKICGDQIQSYIVWWPTFYHLATLFSAVWSCLIVFGRVWQDLNAFKHSIKRLKTFPLFSYVFYGRCFVCLNSLIKHFWREHAYHAACIHSLTCIWSNMFWPFGHSLQHQHVWSPNNVWWCLVAKHFPFGQALR